jgi:collagenase-like PrtC family protease
MFIGSAAAAPGFTVRHINKAAEAHVDAVVMEDPAVFLGKRVPGFVRSRG